ncbi:hypothetical protein ACL03H_04400 [Saccharopolyspora sp. MS10]|uniref:hypothetical protein n=1 Tax=Saccharopolyspora sp. MS10 TaxID=3385973 RepID=UPI0039A2E3D1
MARRRPARSTALVCGGLVLLGPLLTSAYLPPAPGGADADRPRSSSAPPPPTGSGPATPDLVPGDPDLGWPIQHPRLSLSTSVRPGAARLGEPVTQTAVLRNTGDVALAGTVVTLDIGPCHQVLGRLRPGEARTASCSGSAPHDGSLGARAVGMTDLGVAALARASAQIERIEPPPPPPTPEKPSVSLEILPPRAGAVPVRVRNTSAVELLDVRVSGEPPSCGRDLGALAPGRSTTYECRAAPGQTVRLSVSARSLEGEAAAADALLVVPLPEPAPAVPPPPQEPPTAREAPVPPPAPRPEPAVTELADAGGPRESPAGTAGFIAILGVLVMMVSVGALSTSTRPGR